MLRTISLLVFTLLFSSSNFAHAALDIGALAPDFTLKDQDGKEHTLSQYRGSTVVLEWINPECPFVKRHYRSRTMASLANTYSEHNVVWLAIDSSHFVTPQQSKKWIRKYDLNYPILQDPTGEVGKLYSAKTTPHMYVIDSKGKLRYQGAIDNDSWGRKSRRELQNYVRDTLKKIIPSLSANPGSTPSETKPYGCSVKYK